MLKRSKKMSLQTDTRKASCHWILGPTVSCKIPGSLIIFSYTSFLSSWTLKTQRSTLSGKMQVHSSTPSARSDPTATGHSSGMHILLICLWTIMEEKETSEVLLSNVCHENRVGTNCTDFYCLIAVLFRSRSRDCASRSCGSLYS